MFRRSLIVLTFGLLFTPLVSADPAAEQFAQGLIDQGLAILRDESAGDAGRRARFHAFLVQHVDARKTALFTLGQYRRSADEATLTTFTDVFRDYAMAIYESKLERNKASSLKVVGSVDHKPGDVTVNARAESPEGREPVRLAVRLMRSGGVYKIVDVQAEGIWLSVEQRDQFATFLSKNNGDVSALMNHLRSQTSRMRMASAG